MSDTDMLPITRGTMRVYSGMAHLYGNPLAGIDLETTGRRPGFHEIVQIAIVPLNSDFEPHPEIRPFYTNIKPDFPERAEPSAMRQNGLRLEDLILTAPSQDRVADLLEEWFNTIDLPVGKHLVPLAHNWAFESSFLSAWLGPDLKDQIFHGHARDTMLIGGFLNDRAAFMGQDCPFPRSSLMNMAGRFHITNEQAHDALHDVLTTVKLYQHLVTLGL